MIIFKALPIIHSNINSACWVIFHALDDIRVSNRLDPDQNRHSVSPDLGPNCLQWLLAEEHAKS